VTVGSWLLDTNGATAHIILLPAPPAVIEPGCDACRCDLNGVVAGVDIGAEGGCIAGRKVFDMFGKGDFQSLDASSPVPLCPVPNECTDAKVQNATDTLRAVYGEWEQPAGFAWRLCSAGDDASDECDPTADATRDNAFAFVTVFAVQCCAIALGHVVLMWKLRRMVKHNQKNRLRAMSDPQLEKRARCFVADAKARQERAQKEGGSSEGSTLSARAKFRRAGILAKFSVRVTRAAQQQESVDDVVLEISEVVATHWKASWLYFVAAGTSAMAITFTFAAMVAGAQGS
jgi:hypothetical protein